MLRLVLYSPPSPGGRRPFVPCPVWWCPSSRLGWRGPAIPVGPRPWGCVTTSTDPRGDEGFVSWCPCDGRPGLSPARPVTVCVLRFLPNLSARQEIGRLPLEEGLTVIPTFHPVRTEAGPRPDRGLRPGGRTRELPGLGKDHPPPRHRSEGDRPHQHGRGSAALGLRQTVHSAAGPTMPSCDDPPRSPSSSTPATTWSTPAPPWRRTHRGRKTHRPPHSGTGSVLTLACDVLAALDEPVPLTGYRRSTPRPPGRRRRPGCSPPAPVT